MIWLILGAALVFAGFMSWVCLPIEKALMEDRAQAAERQREMDVAVDEIIAERRQRRANLPSADED